jgi:ABC-type uncharacterized transport system substrate-binding protein
MTRAQADALVLIPSGLFFSHRSQLAALAMQHRLPAMFLEREFVEAGGLIAYGPSMSALSRRAATYVDKILREASPRTCPWSSRRSSSWSSTSRRLRHSGSRYPHRSSSWRMR